MVFNIEYNWGGYRIWGRYCNRRKDRVRYYNWLETGNWWLVTGKPINKPPKKVNQYKIYEMTNVIGVLDRAS